MINLQKASFGKRIIVFIFDFICIVTLAVGLTIPLSSAVGYDGYVDKLDNIREKYQAEYNIPEITTDEYNKLTEQEKEYYANDYKAAVDSANQALKKDKEAISTWNMVTHLILLIITIPLLISVITIEFIVPLFFGNGQTLGKKIFGIALMHTDGIKVSNIQLFIRAVLGKFTIELMIPIYITVMILSKSIGIISVAILAILLIAQIICLIATRTNSLLHDVMAGTVAVDMASQRIFESREALIEHTKKLHAQQANKPTY